MCHTTQQPKRQRDIKQPHVPLTDSVHPASIDAQRVERVETAAVFDGTSGDSVACDLGVFEEGFARQEGRSGEI